MTKAALGLLILRLATRLPQLIALFQRTRGGDSTPVVLGSITDDLDADLEALRNTEPPPTVPTDAPG